MSIKEKLREKEQAMTYSPPVSGSPIRDVIRILGLTDVKPGQRVVDLASGACGLTAYLVEERRADAYGFDKLYLDKQVLSREVDKYRSWVETTYGLYHPDSAPLVAESLDAFDISFHHRHPDRYLGGWLTNPRFPTNFAHRTVSMYGLLELAEDEEVLYAAWDEAIRITEPEGTVVAAPLYSAWDNPTYYLDQHTRLIEYLNRQDRSRVSVQPYRVPGTEGEKIIFDKNSSFE